MTSIYILTVKKTGEMHYFTSVKAIYGMFSREDLRTAYRTINAHVFKNNSLFENAHIKVKKVVAYTLRDFDKVNL